MCGYFGTKKIVLLNYPLGLSLLKYRNVWVFWNKKKSGSNRCSLLNSSIDIISQIYIYEMGSSYTGCNSLELHLL